MSTVVLPSAVDVVVLGGGLAGNAAALSAAQSGASVLHLEKTGAIGGSTVLSAGLSAFADTDEQREAGIEDSTDLLREDIIASGFGKGDPALVDLYCDQQKDTYRWLKDLGVVYGHVHAAAGQSVPRSHPTDTTRMLALLQAAGAQAGVQLHTRVAARRLLVENGKVVGVQVSQGSDTGEESGQVVHCAAVVLATGGFARNREMLEKFAPQMRLAHQAGGEGNVGDGLLMAWALGADVIDTPYIKGTYGIHPRPHPGEHGTGIHAIYKGGIAVNKQGLRFVDESLPYKVVGDANLLQSDGESWQIFDERAMQASDSSVAIFDLAGRRDSGILVSADSIDELAQKIDVPTDVLTATVAEYNRRIQDGEPDEFARVHLSGRVGTIFPLVNPPFHAHLSGTVVLATYCGLKVDTTMRVLDVFGDPIQGLHAAGEIIGGFHGGGYMTGTSIGKAGIFGRIAGQAAAAAVQHDQAVSHA